jgi:hypothetical protein
MYGTKDEEKHNTIPSFKLNLNTIVVPPVSSTNKTDSHDITEILLKVALKL